MIAAHEVRALTIAQASASNRPAYLSAASGLVCVQSWIYVVADDEHHLGVFRRDRQAPGILFRLLEGELPDGPKKRKKHKADFEVLLRLPAFGNYAQGALLAAGSGSRTNRQAGVIVGLDDTGALHGEPKRVDLAFMFGALERELSSVNVEGAVVVGSDLVLFQRGNKGGANAVITLSLAKFLEAIDGTHSHIAPRSIQTIDLGRINDIPLSFTDAAVLPNGEIVFSAVAEDTDDPYNDGRCAGSALGMLGADGTRRWLRKLAHPHKIEGLDVRRENENLAVLMVTDADDVSIPAKLLSTTTSYG